MSGFSEEDIAEFKAEALESLDVAEKFLLALDEGHADYQTAYGAVFRSFHNLKGGAGMMELAKLQSHTHELENILMSFKEKTSMPKQYVSFFLRGIDGARALLDNEDIQFNYNIDAVAVSEPTPQVVTKVIEIADQATVSNAALDEFISECDEINERISKNLQNLEKGQFTKDNIDSLYRDIHSLKGAAYLFGYNHIGDISHAMESCLEPVRNGTHKPSQLLIDALFKSTECIDQEVKNIKTNTVNKNIEVQAPLLCQSLNAAMAQLETRLEKNNPNKETAIKSEIEKSDQETGGSIRVPISLLDNLMTLIGEMVLVRNQVIQFSSQSEDLEFINLSKRLNVVTSEIQGEMMKTRMQPVGNVLTKFHRVVRDLSHDLKKDIELNLFGAETELDKSLLEAIKDPLTHIVRNSCDHGIEMPESRVQAGKSESGTINIKSYHEGGQVVIEVSDDGKGLHKDMLIRKAVEKGVITQSQSLSLSEKETFNLIFAPGFSTAATITNVSGRGVGMDVVRTNVEKIGGSVELTSVAGKGTTTKLKIPLTLAIVPALIVKAANEIFAIPQVKLEELVRIDNTSETNKVEYLHGSPVYRLRGNLLPLLSLNKVLGKEETESVDKTHCNIAVLNADGNYFGLIIDEVHDTADIVVKPLNRLLKSLQVYSGATILGDGSVALILDVLGISKIAQLVNQSNKTQDSLSSAYQDKHAVESQDYLVVNVNSTTKHAFVLGYVHRLEEIKKSAVEYSGQQRIVRYGNTLLPVISVSHELGYGESNKNNDKEKLNVIVVQKAGTLYGLEVDEIVDTLSTQISIDSSLEKHKGIFGHLNTESELITIIDPFEIINAFENKNVIQINDIQKNNSSKSVENSTYKILLVEDTVFFRKVISKELEKAGHQVVTANHGQEALDILNKNHKFDLIVSDIEMPVMNGFEMAQAIRANKSLAHLPMLAISTRADSGYMAKGISSGFNVYLEKLKPDVLHDSIRKLVESKRMAS